MKERAPEITLMEDELLEFEQYINDLWRFLPIPVGVLTPLGIFVESGVALRKLLQMDADEIVGRELTDFSPSKLKMEMILAATLKEGKVNNIECSLTKKDGKEVRVAVSTLARIDSGGGEGGIGTIFIAFYDLTERLKAENELVRSRKLESLGVLAGGIAHDFNNLLMSIMGNLSLSREELGSNNPISHYLAESIACCDQAKQLSQQLLTFSRGGRPVKEVASLPHIIYEMTRLSLSGSPVRCEFSIDDDLRLVEIDGGQIGQVINNLIRNAIQAMPEGGKIDIKAENHTVSDSDNIPGLSPGQYVKITFRDRGRGIPDEDADKIFDPYFTTRPDGSGLGLATAYSIVNNHDGLISFQSTRGQGTSFYVFLPATDQTLSPPEIIPKEITSGTGRILIMDDDNRVRKVLGKLVKHLGYEVELVRDGREAIACYRRAREEGASFDAVILDLTIADGMGGKETIGKLRDIDPAVRAIVSSGYSNDPVMASCRDFGFSGVIAKPFSVQKLGQTLHQVLAEG